VAIPWRHLNLQKLKEEARRTGSAQGIERIWEKEFLLLQELSSGRALLHQ